MLNPAALEERTADLVGRPLAKAASALVPGEMIFLGPDPETAVVGVVARNVSRGARGGRIYLRAGTSVAYDPEMTFLLEYPAVNVWSADAYGDGRHSGTRWALYRDDDEVGADTSGIYAAGPVTEGEYLGYDDDWLYGDAARDFLATATYDES